MLIVHTTLPDLTSAEALARRIVEERLAGCVQIGAPLQSIYRWQGQLETATEIPLSIKTSRARYTALEHCTRTHHPYEVPEIVATPVESASAAYADWVRQQTAA